MFDGFLFLNFTFTRYFVIIESIVHASIVRNIVLFVVFTLLGKQIYPIGYCPIDKESAVPRYLPLNYFKILSGGPSPTKASTLASQLEQQEYSDHTTPHTLFSSWGTNLQVSWVNSQTHEVISGITREEYL